MSLKAIQDPQKKNLRSIQSKLLYQQIGKVIHRHQDIGVAVVSQYLLSASQEIQLPLHQHQCSQLTLG